MLTYVDTSTLLKLIVEEDGSDRAGVVWQSADTLASVALVVVEARAALAAATRAGRLTSRQHAATKNELAALVVDLFIVDPADELIAQAAELAELEALRGDDAIHLAAALTIGAPVLTSADTELCDAAARRGLHVANPMAN